MDKAISEPRMHVVVYAHIFSPFLCTFAIQFMRAPSRFFSILLLMLSVLFRPFSHFNKQFFAPILFPIKFTYAY